MFTTLKNASKNGFFSSRKLLLGLGGLAVAGTLMAAAPAQARDRFEEHHGREIRHERVVVRPEVVAPVIVEPAPVVVAPVVPAPVQIWVPDRYEIRTRSFLGCRFTERVLVEPGHWVCR